VEGRLVELVAYRSTHNCDIAERTLYLSQWMDVRRSKREKEKLSADHVKQLDGVGLQFRNFTN